MDEDTNASINAYCSYSDNKCCGNIISKGITSSDIRIGSDKLVLSKVPKTNDDRFSIQRGLKKCNHHKTTMRDSRLNRTIGAFPGGYAQTFASSQPIKAGAKSIRARTTSRSKPKKTYKALAESGDNREAHLGD
ncbi:hypothetical protein Ancab_029710 [Ancistrocladus abbreviatus]